MVHIEPLPRFLMLRDAFAFQSSVIVTYSPALAC